MNLKLVLQIGASAFQDTHKIYILLKPISFVIIMKLYEQGE